MNPRFRKFLSYYKKYWKRFLMVMLAALVASAAGLMIPLCTRHIAQLTLSGAEAGRAILRTGAFMLLLIGVQLAFDFYYDYFGHALGARMESDLRSELFAHLEALSFRFYDVHKVGHLMSSLTNDLLNLTELFHHGPEDYVMNLVRLVGASAILFWIHPALAAVLVAFVPVMILCTVLWGKRLRRVSAENQARIADINASASDVLTGIRTVQAFTQEQAQRRRFDRAGERFFVSRKAVYRNESYADKTTMGLTQLSMAAVILFGGIHVLNGSLDLAGLIAFTMYVSYLTEPVQKLSWMITQFQTGMAGFDRVMDLMETEPEIADGPKAVRAQDVRGELTLSGVTFRYGEGELVLNGLDLHIPAGQFVALVGVSGMGKSTLGALLPRFYEPQAGTIALDGVDVRSYALQSLREQIAWVQQDTYLFDATVADNIRMGRPDATMDEVRQAARLADADEFISRLPEGYDSFVGERGVRLSGGQRQRIGVARAFLKDAPVLVLDEATSALDNFSEQRVHDAIRKLRDGRTTLVIAHRLSAIRDAQRIVVLDGGCVVEDGTHDALLQKDGVYAALYRRQQEA